MLQLKKDAILIEFDDASKAGFEGLQKSVSSDPAIARNAPLTHFQIDPRNGDRVVYSEARARRPHDTKKPENEILRSAQNDSISGSCVVCEGKTTSIVDMTPTSEGFTFINKNLFPVTYPFGNDADSKDPFNGTGQQARGIHLLQWPSNLHDKDLDNMPLEDVFIVLKRLCILERNLLHFAGPDMPLSHVHADGNHYGYIGVIKNMGRLVGGSLVHGHHQIVHTNVKPRKILDDQRFKESALGGGLGFSQHLLGCNPVEYCVKEYQGGVILLVPYFMKRPLDAMVVFRDYSRDYLHHLSDKELYSLGEALRDVMSALKILMPRMGRELAYNWVIHEGDVGGMYVEILPWTQEMGGYEQLGMYLCQGRPESTVNYYRELIH
jgi:galactose-1-phosphate uridylyltransferase